MPPSGRQTPPPEAPMNIITEPRVYLVGRQNVDRSQVDRFLGEYGMSWETDTEGGGEQLAEAGGRLCSLSFGKGRKTNAEYISNIIGQKHGSVLEHAVWNFIIAGVSRSFTHELIRHRAGWGYSQLSQRYVDESMANYIEPAIIAEDERLHATWLRAVEQSPQACPPGRPLRPPQRHRDDDLRHRERPRPAPLHRAARLRVGGGGDPQGRPGVPAHHARRGPQLLLRLRGRPPGRRHRGRPHPLREGVRVRLPTITIDTNCINAKPSLRAITRFEQAYSDVRDEI